MNDTVWESIFKKLTNENIDVYSPSQHEGECKTKFVVLKSNGSSKVGGISSYYDSYLIMAYVPQNDYSKLEGFINDILNIMKYFKPIIKFNGFMTPSYYDNEKKAHTISIEFDNVKKMY